MTIPVFGPGDPWPDMDEETAAEIRAKINRWPDTRGLIKFQEMAERDPTMQWLKLMGKPCPHCGKPWLDNTPTDGD